MYAGQGFLQNLSSPTAVPADVLPFPDAIQKGPGHSTQAQTLALNISSSAAVTPYVAIGEAFSSSRGGGSETVTFDPVSTREYEDTLILRDGVELGLDGAGTAEQIIYVNRAGLKSYLDAAAAPTAAIGKSLTASPMLTAIKNAISANEAGLMNRVFAAAEA